MLLIDSKSIHHLDDLRLRMKFGKEVEGSKEGVCHLCVDDCTERNEADLQTTYSTPGYTYHPSTSPD